MINSCGSKLIVILIVILPIVQSCAGTKNSVPSPSPVKASAPVKDRPETISPASVPRPAVNPAGRYMKAGEYQKAIEAYSVECRERPNDEALAEEYVKSIVKIASTADKALKKGDLASAGRNYDVLLKNYPRFKGMENKLPFSATDLSRELDFCKKTMFKQGFQEYRKGNLDRAIELWEKLRTFDPHNAEIKKVLSTARMQQENLKEKH